MQYQFGLLKYGNWIAKGSLPCTIFHKSFLREIDVIIFPCTIFQKLWNKQCQKKAKKHGQEMTLSDEF